MSLRQGGWLIPLTVAIAFVLTAARVPEEWPGWLGWLRPGWVLLTLCFWAMAAPQRIGPVSAWIIGLFLDELRGDPLGLNALILALAVHFASRFHQRLRMYGLLQQCTLAFLIMALAELARQIGASIVEVPRWTWLAFLPAVTSAVLWTLLQRLLGRLKQGVGVD